MLLNWGHLPLTPGTFGNIKRHFWSLAVLGRAGMLLASEGKKLGMLPNVLQYVINWIGRPPTNVDSAETEKPYFIEL